MTGSTRTGQFDALMLSVADGWSTGDVDQALAAFAQDAVLSEPPDRVEVVGHGALRERFAALGEDFSMQWHHLWFDPDSQVGAGEYTVRGDGGDEAEHGVAVVELDDGRIRVWRQYQRSGPADVAAFRGAGG